MNRSYRHFLLLEYVLDSSDSDSSEDEEIREHAFNILFLYSISSPNTYLSFFSLSEMSSKMILGCFHFEQQDLVCLLFVLRLPEVVICEVSVHFILFIRFFFFMTSLHIGGIKMCPKCAWHQRYHMLMLSLCSLSFQFRMAPKHPLRRLSSLCCIGLQQVLPLLRDPTYFIIQYQSCHWSFNGQ
jgi:CBS domain containing-hemolysin-like protein